MGASISPHFVIAAVVLVVSGCASARLVLEKPVADECTSAGLADCPDLTDGVLLFVEGDSTNGKAKLVEAARANEPDKLREFATTVSNLTSLPGVSSYAGPIHTVASILATTADEGRTKEPARIASRVGRQKAKWRPPVVDEQDEAAVEVKPVLVNLDEPAVAPLARATVAASPPNIEGGTVVPMIETGAIPCQLGAPIGAAILCVQLAKGPLVVSDLHLSGLCQTDLFIADGPPETPRWLLVAPARAALHITGAQLLVRADEALLLAVSPKTRADGRCAVTWSGVRL